MAEKVAILGARDNPERYSYKAQEFLMEKDYEVFPVSIRDEEIMGVKTYKALEDLPAGIDTLTVYINSTHFDKLVDKVAESDIRRVIFNPGTESEENKAILEKAGKEVVEACTLVMIRTNQF